jgi:hypothetical protein
VQQLSPLMDTRVLGKVEAEVLQKSPQMHVKALVQHRLKIVAVCGMELLVRLLEIADGHSSVYLRA